MPPPPGFATGHVRYPNKDHLMTVNGRRHVRLALGLASLPLPATWDSRTLGWVGPIKSQGGCGSCHDAATEVLTEKGWVAWPDYDWRTPLGTMNPDSNFLEFQVPIVQHIYDHDGPMHYYEGRSLDFALTPNHRMVWRRGGGQWRKSAITDLPSYVNIPHATLGWQGTELERLGVGDRVYRGDDFLALVALVISDGHVGHKDDGNGGRNNITFCCFREDRQERVRALAHRLSIPEQASRPGVFYFRDGDLAEWFRQNAYGVGGYTAPYKHIPAIVKCASQRQVSHFLHMFGDQHTQAYGGRRFYSCSPLMIDDLQELLLRIGKRGTVEEHPPRTTHNNATGRVFEGKHPELMLTERKRDSLCIEKENTHIDHYKGKVYCATVANGTLVTRRNKRVLISSNCWDFSGTFCVEVAWYKTGILKSDGSDALSEQYTLDCGRNGGCRGDDNITVLEWAKKTGLPRTADYGSYMGHASQCKFKTTEKLYLIDDYVFADPNNQNGVAAPDLIKPLIMTAGGVGCGVDAGFRDPGTGIITGGGNNIDHDVALVGWQDTATKVTSTGVTMASVSTVASAGYWIMRNSWDKSWGDGGYAKITYGAYAIGTEAVAAIVNASMPPIDWAA